MISLLLNQLNYRLLEQPIELLGQTAAEMLIEKITNHSNERFKVFKT